MSDETSSDPPTLQECLEHEARRRSEVEARVKKLLQKNDAQKYGTDSHSEQVSSECSANNPPGYDDP